jgi:hypothetical protein
VHRETPRPHRPAWPRRPCVWEETGYICRSTLATYSARQMQPTVSRMLYFLFLKNTF